MRHAPRINPIGLPPEERDVAAVLAMQLSLLEGEASNFRNAVTLIDFSRTNMHMAAKNSDDFWRFYHWQFVAARDGAVTLYNIVETKQAIEKIIGALPSLRESIDKARTKEAGRILRDTFPDLEKIRTGVAHAGKLYKSPKKLSQNALFGTVLIRGSLSDAGHFTLSMDGKQVGYDLTERNADALEAACEAFFDGYQPLQEITFQMYRSSRVLTSPGESKR